MVPARIARQTFLTAHKRRRFRVSAANENGGIRIGQMNVCENTSAISVLSGAPQVPVNIKECFHTSTLRVVERDGIKNGRRLLSMNEWLVAIHKVCTSGLLFRFSQHAPYMYRTENANVAHQSGWYAYDFYISGMMCEDEMSETRKRKRHTEERERERRRGWLVMAFKLGISAEIVVPEMITEYSIWFTDTHTSDK